MNDDPDFDEGENASPGPAWLGPKASEHELVTRSRAGRGLSLRAMLPNAITAAALASGLTGISLAIVGDWKMALFAIILAGILDAMDGRIARLLKAQSRFGAELDSLADSISFGVAPALVLFLWSLGDLPRLGWLAALAFAICCALRLARFNAQIDVEEQPHKSAGFLTGVPAPMGAGLSFLPMYLWLATGDATFRNPALVAPWTLLIAILMVSNMATPSWKSLRPSTDFRIAAIAIAALTVAALLRETWWTLVLISGVYLVLILWAFLRYQKVKRARKAARVETTLTPPEERKPLGVDEAEQALSRKPDP